MDMRRKGIWNIYNLNFKIVDYIFVLDMRKPRERSFFQNFTPRMPEMPERGCSVNCAVHGVRASTYGSYTP